MPRVAGPTAGGVGKPVRRSGGGAPGRSRHPVLVAGEGAAVPVPGHGPAGPVCGAAPAGGGAARPGRASHRQPAPADRGTGWRGRGEADQFSPPPPPLRLLVRWPRRPVLPNRAAGWRSLPVRPAAPANPQTLELLGRAGYQHCSSPSECIEPGAGGGEGTRDPAQPIPAPALPASPGGRVLPRA